METNGAKSASLPAEVTASETKISNEAPASPALYLCSNCSLPLGDSGDYTAQAQDKDIIQLKAVTENVEIEENKAVSSYKLDAFSTVQILYCKGCSLTLGALYIATPDHLDYKRDLFNLNSSAVTCYRFDNPHKQTRKIVKNAVKLPSISYVEAQLQKCKTMLGFCARGIAQIDKKLSQSREKPK
ncbi:protein Mis18-alpha-like [Engystomops pustulosus]|uniref:protein Mis18-alpha-like n=1 Tax=Engystomops pustulosus TaxID=76066 RepID=UPI003AFA6D0F